MLQLILSAAISFKNAKYMAQLSTLHYKLLSTRVDISSYHLQWAKIQSTKNVRHLATRGHSQADLDR